MKQKKPKTAGRERNVKAKQPSGSRIKKLRLAKKQPVSSRPDIDAIITSGQTNQKDQTNKTNQKNQSIAKPAGSDAIIAPNESNQTSQTNQTNPTNQTPYNENLLESARADWQAGNWEGLARLERSSLQDHPDRAKLALLAAVGRQHQGDNGAARQYARLALEWECGKKLVAQVLIAGVHNTLGRAAAAAGASPRALKHFEAAVAAGAPVTPSTLQTQARIVRELEEMGLPGAAGIQLAGTNAVTMHGGEKVSVSNNVISVPV